MKNFKRYRFRKADYIIIFIATFLFYLINIFGSIDFKTILALLVSATITAGILGTLTNLIWKKRD